MSDKLLHPLLCLVDRGKPELAEQQACAQVDTLLGFLGGLYQSGRLEDNGSALKYASLAVGLNKTAKNVANLIFLLNKAGRRDEVWPTYADYNYNAKDSTEDVANLQYNYACVLMEVGNLKDAARVFRQARSLNPDCAMTHYQLSNVLMALGEYREGLQEDQWRFKAHSQLARFRKRFKAPDWNKSAERVLVFSEQGLGDAIQCARYLKYLKKEMGCRVILEIQSELADLFKNDPWVDEVHGRESTDYTSEVIPPEAYDSVLSINSLPFHFDPDLNSPPTDKYLDPSVETPPLLLHPEMKVGLVWAGSRFHSNDRDRSCPLRNLAPLFEIKDLELLNFQQGDMVRTWCRGNSTLWDGDDNYDVVDLNEGAEALLEKMSNPIADCKSFFETALVLKQLDLLITVDTALAHLAGAMGVPTWLMLPNAHEWRWRRPWYTSVTYYRQDKQGDWSGLVKRIAIDLRQKAIDR